MILKSILTNLSLIDFPLLSIGPAHFNFKGSWWSIFIFLFKFLIDPLYINSGDPDQTPRYTASDLGLHCLRTSHKKDASLIWVKIRAHIIPLCSRHFLDRTEKSIPGESMLYPFLYHAKFQSC